MSCTGCGDSVGYRFEKTSFLKNLLRNQKCACVSLLMKNEKIKRRPCPSLGKLVNLSQQLLILSLAHSMVHFISGRRNLCELYAICPLLCLGLSLFFFFLLLRPGLSFYYVQVTNFCLPLQSFDASLSQFQNWGGGVSYNQISD